MNKTITEDSSVIPTPSNIGMQQTTTTSSKCKICGAPARYSYYDAMTCESCKVFFKRNAEAGQGVLKCHFDGQCDINMNSRHTCASCRLKKCFASGMSVKMIRCSRTKKNKKKKKKKSISDSTQSRSTALVTRDNKNQPEQIVSLNLLRSDRSTLNNAQWTLLSNLVQCFDEYSGYSFVERFIQEQNALPPKLRFKYSLVKDFFTSMKTKVQLAFEKNRNFLSLSFNDRATLLRNTVQHTSSIGGLFIVRQTHLFDYPSFFKSTEMIFRSDAAAFSKRAVDQLGPDNTFIKLILAILACSTTNYTVYTKYVPTNLTNIKAIISIQDMYIELAWRYLLYKYGHQQAVIRFLNLIRCLFSVNNAIVAAHASQQFTEMIDTIVEQTEQTLSL